MEVNGPRKNGGLREGKSALMARKTNSEMRAEGEILVPGKG